MCFKPTECEVRSLYLSMVPCTRYVLVSLYTVHITCLSVALYVWVLCYGGIWLVFNWNCWHSWGEAEWLTFVCPYKEPLLRCFLDVSAPDVATIGNSLCTYVALMLAEITLDPCSELLLSANNYYCTEPDEYMYISSVPAQKLIWHKITPTAHTQMQLCVLEQNLNWCLMIFVNI